MATPVAVPESAPVGISDASSLRTMANQLVVSQVNQRMTPRVRQAVIAYSLGLGAYAIAKKWTNRAKAHVEYVVTVEANDDLYGVVHEWLMGALPNKRQQSLSAKTLSGRSGANDVVESDMPESTDSYGGPSSTRRSRSLAFRYNGNRSASIRIDGYRVKVAVIRPENFNFDMDKPFRPMQKYDQITFTTYGTKGRDAVLSLLSRLSNESNVEVPPRPKFYMTTKWGEWQKQSDVPRRNVDSLILRDGQIEEILGDVRTFIDREDRYAKLGIPYHRGYLLRGIPGTGKTSMAKALSEFFDMDLYYIHLADLEMDTSLLRLISGISPRSICLIEDIDRLDVARVDGKAADGLTLSGLLNALDGIGTPNGVIFVLTTNHAEKLDPAIVRPGRVDLTMEIGEVDTDQVERILEMGYDRPFDLSDLKFQGLGISPAQIVEKIKTNLDDPLEAELAVRELAS